MTGPATQPVSVGQGAHLMLYDGTCGLCSRLMQLLLRHDRRALFNFAALQSEVARATIKRFGGDPNELDSFYVVANYRGNAPQIFGRSRAALFVAGELGWPWKAAVLVRVLPTAILDRVYNAIAQHRYAIFGRVDRCLLPTPEFRSRFVE